jgi:uncharacterized glyoxalase superfamily protein PhnB
MAAWKPEGHSAVSPYLVVQRAEDTIAFLRAAFGAELILRHERPGGGVMHAELRIDDSVVMLGEAMDGFPASPCHVHVYVPDVDSAFGKAIVAGGEPVQEPEQKGDADKRGGVRDPSGITWWIATRVG